MNNAISQYILAHRSPLLWRGVGGEVQEKGPIHNGYWNKITKHVLVLAVIFSLPFGERRGGASFAQNSDTFMRLAGAPGMNGGLSLAETSDGGFVGTGQQQAGGSGGCDVYVFKVDACGTLQWEKLFGNGADDGGKYVQQTADGGYIVSGLYNGVYNVLLLKLDPLGNLQWSKTYGNGYGLFVQQTADKGYILTGFSSGYGWGAEDITLVKTDSLGNIMWKKIFGGGGSDWGDYVEQTKDKGYIVAGYTTSFGAGSFDLFLLKVDSLGNMQWNKSYGGPGADGSSQWGLAGQQTSDGGYMVCGNTNSYGAGSNDALLIKTDSLGNLTWAKTYGGTNDDQPRFTHQTANHGFVICGITRSFGAGDLDAYLIRTDSIGNLKWSKAYGGANYDKCEMVRESPDGGFALSVMTLNFGASYYDPLFIKTDSLGVVGCYEANCATVVNTVNPSVGTGANQMVPSFVAASPTLNSNSYTPTDVFICRHCITVPAFVPSDTSVCVGQTVYFYNTTTIGIRCFEDWYINGTIQNGDKDTLPFVFNTAGTHVIQLISNCGNATDTNTINIHVYDYPVAAFTNTSVCSGNGTQFTDASTIPSGTISIRLWDFGDGSPLNTAQSPLYTYATPGNYITTLIVSNFIGCADTLTKPVKVFFNPTASFTYNDVCFHDTMHFSNTSTVDTSTSITTYLWVFGDGSPTSNIKNPSHYYSNYGTNTVTLVATTADGCSNAVAHTVNTFDPPTSAFTFNNTCLFAAASFINTTISPTMGSTANWSWNFGDSSPTDSTTLSPQHLYAVPGNYPVTLITHSTNLGCPDTLQTSITVYPMPIANFSFKNVCLNKPMQFYDSSTVASGSVTTWAWNYGDATPLITLPNPAHTYATYGTDTVTLIIITSNGCKDTISKKVVVHPLPTPLFATSNVCADSIAQFTDGSTIPATDTIQTWSWNFGDNSAINNNPNTNHTFNINGSYPVQLVTVSKFGCRDSITKTSVINPNPVVIFSASPNLIGCEALCLTFTDLSIVATGGLIQWLWNPGDGSPLGSSQNFAHCYHNNSIYDPDTLNVSLTVTSDSGCVTSGTRNNYITVYPNPTAIFTVQPQTTTILDPVISITNLSTGADFFAWNFGAPIPAWNDTSSMQHPLPHTYLDTGTYVVMLITSTKHNCKDTTYQTVIIEPDFTFYIPNSFTPNDDGINDSFSGKGIFIKEYEMSIYDRWGNLIFFTDDIDKPWDGKANHGNEMAQRDVYVYSVKVTDYKRKKHSFKGVVTLVR